MSQLTICLLGSPQIEVNGKPMEVDTRKAVALVAYLAATGQSQRRSSLATLLWPESDDRRARSALRRTLATLNKAIGKEWIEADRYTVGLVERDGLLLDTGQFTRLVEGCVGRAGGVAALDCLHCLPRLKQAADLYRGDFLEGFTLYDSEAFDEWQLFQVESWRRKMAAVLRALVHCHAAEHQFERAIDYARRWVALESFHEPAYRELMRVYALAGQRAAAVHQYEECRRILKEELGVSPQPETTLLYEEILSGKVASPAPAARDWRPAVPATPPPPSRIPRQLTSFVGRQRELQEIHSLLDDPDRRLITILGPGGIGKTRLSLEAAAARKGRHRDGVYFVPLGAVSSPNYLVSTIAETLDFSFYGGRLREDELKDQLLDYLRHKQMLLVLDNFEHLLEGASLLAEMLEEAPRVQILVTSQERLNLQGEWLVEIYGLECPSSNGATGEPGSVVKLFQERARQVSAGFRLRQEDRPFLARICRLVGGMPLGIELASTWVRMLSCQEIADQIERNLDFLASSMRNVPDRHRSLRAVFEYSWQLLSPQERDVFRKLSVFRGGFDALAVGEVVGAPLPLLLGLADKSLLYRTESGRYEIPEVLRQYAVEKFEADVDETVREEVRARHCHYYLDFLSARHNDLRGDRQRAALAEIGEEIENVRHAWRRAVSERDYEMLDRGLDPLFLFYQMRSWFQEGEEVFGQVVGIAADSPLLRGRALSRQGRLQVRLSRTAQGKESLEQALALLQELEATGEVAGVLSMLGVVAETEGDYPRAREYQLESLTRYRAVGDVRGEADALLRLGNVAYMVGIFEEARDYYRDSLALRRQVGDQRGAALCLNNLGSVTDSLGEYAEALRLYEESVVIKREMGDRRGVAYSLNNLGYLHYVTHDYETADKRLEEALALFREVGDRRGIAYALTNLGNVVSDREDYDRARALYEESLAVAQEIGHKVGMAYALNHLGNIERLLGRTAEARQRYRAALVSALGVHAMPVILEILVEVAVLLLDLEAPEQAITVLAAILAQPAGRQQTREKAMVLLEEAVAAAGPDVAARARAAGEAADLEQLAANLFEE